MTLKAKYIDGNKAEQEMEIDASDIAMPLDISIGDDSPENILALTMKLLRPVLRVGDTGISSKNLLHWKISGLLLEQHANKKGWTQFSYIEFIWLQIVRELREFGVSLEVIKRIKEDLIYPNDLHKEAVKKYAVSVIKQDKDNKGLPLEKLKSMSDMFIFMDATVNISDVICECIINQDNMQLMVFKDGESFFHNDKEEMLFKRTGERYDSPKAVDKGILRFRSHIAISLSDILKNYTLFNKQALKVNALPIMSEDERELLQHIQRQDIKSITIKYKNQKPHLLEVEEDKPVVDLASRYTDHVMKHGYQTISYVMEDGKMVTFSRTTKIKLK